MDEARHGLARGYTIEGYRIERVLGAGGFGVTYLASEVAISRPVAIKEYLPHGIAARSRDDVTVQALSGEDRENFQWGLERFRREAQTLVAFHHANVVSVFRYFEANGTAYLVMAYEDGDSLATLLEKRKTLPEAELRGWLTPLLSGLAHVHQAGFLHRDIKPGNIYIRKDGSPVLLDFGAARLAVGSRSQSLTSIVSAGYAPFEQYTTRGNQGPWTDIYAMGGVLYRAVTGQRPPDAPDRIRDDPYEAAAKKAARGKYSASLGAAIDAALIVDEEKRPQNLDQWLAVLDGGHWPPEAEQPAAEPALEPAHHARDATIAVGAAEVLGRDRDGSTRWPAAERSSQQRTAQPTAATRAPAARRGGGMAKWIVIGGLALAGVAAAGTLTVVLMQQESTADRDKRLADARAALARAAVALERDDFGEAERQYAAARRLAPDLPEVKAFPAKIETARRDQPARAVLRRVGALLVDARAAIARRDFAAADRAIREAEALARQNQLGSTAETQIAEVQAELERARRGSAVTTTAGSWPANPEMRRAVDDTIQRLSAAGR